jgi:PhoPQ-activated pathogenicity-related protein
MARFARLRRLAATAALLLVAACLSLALYLRRDTTAVFYRVRGTYAGARVLEEWQLGATRCRWIELYNHRAEAVATAYVRTPRPLPPRPLILITYAGEKTGRQMLDLIPRRPDLVLVAVQYPYERPRTLTQYVRWPYEVRRAVFRTVAGGMLAASFLAEDEHLALDRLTVLGVSLGTSFGVIQGALDPRVANVLVIHGGGDLTRVLWSIERRAGRTWRAPLVAGLGAVLVATFDPLRYADRIAPRPLWILASRNDRYFPVASAQALYDRAREPKRLQWTTTEHVGAKKAAIVCEIVREVERQLDQLAAGSQPQLRGKLGGGHARIRGLGCLVPSLDEHENDRLVEDHRHRHTGPRSDSNAPRGLVGAPEPLDCGW